ncbi:molecular chaperone GrpE [Methyloprofundus sedimenti]|uniref:Protein GrpE n=1 Tax=Methyloprofundus sedimenti TaxID=1420851 RepID=A0A1V8M8B7_9GAMM|nr:nucleotide exchange factor GrpE [Methyloprofundus sedimenti]OQK17633.1 molecular chaperone GrpE [Methyloprofundus sedimenti]
MSKDQPSPESQAASDLIEGLAELDNEETAEAVEVPESEDAELSVEELKKQLAKAEKKAADNWDKVLRVQAEMENLKRRTQKDLDSAHKYGLEKFAKELLSVIDSLELGIQAATSDVPEVVKLREGSELTVKQFEAVFAKFNIEAIDPIGQPFNPEFHQAMTMVPTADAEPNTVINVFQKGYVLNGRLIRPAMVVVAQAIA